MFCLKCCSLVFILLLSSPLVVFCQDNSGTPSRQDLKKLEAVSKQIEQLKNELKGVENQEIQVIAKLNAIEIELQLASSREELIHGKIELIKSKIHATSSSLSSYRTEVDQRESYLCTRLTALYKYARHSGLRILMTAQTYNDILRLENYLGYIIHHDTVLLHDSLDLLGKSNNYYDELNAHHAELLQTQNELLRAKNEIKQIRQDKIALLKRVRAEKNLQIDALKELEQYSQKLQEIIDRLPHDKQFFAPSGKLFSAMRGRLSYPLKGKLITTFGRKNHADLHTYTFQKGIEIEAPMGTEIKAVFDGKVVFADWLKGYGYTIIVDHGESYYSLSAHASALLKNNDDIVRTGESIALVGDTSSTKGSCLYFEIRHHGKPLNPLKWLRKSSS